VADFAKAAKTADLAPGTCKTVQVNGTDVALYNVDGVIHATANSCPHRGGALGEGMLEGRLITCPWHGWQFDVTSGCLATNPLAKVPTYAAKVDGDDILVQL